MFYLDSQRLDRQSNIESLRILAIFLILVVHADFWALGAPSPQEIHDFPTASTTRFLIESISICAVNVFIMISGWFGIHPKAKSLFNFLFQCAFFLFGIYFIKILATGKVSGEGIKGCFLLLKWNWFIKAYLMLYIFSPILNAFVENTNKRTFKIVLICYFLFQTIYGWCSVGAEWFKDGYSAISFFGIYLLMRYLRCYPPPMREIKQVLSDYLFGLRDNSHSTCHTEDTSHDTKLVHVWKNVLVHKSSRYNRVTGIVPSVYQIRIQE